MAASKIKLRQQMAPRLPKKEKEEKHQESKQLASVVENFENETQEGLGEEDENCWLYGQ